MDGGWGSAGKGKMVGYLATGDQTIHAAVCDFMTNAGHWFRSKERGDFLVQQLPMCAVNPNIELFISAGAAISEKVLMHEIEQFEKAGIQIIPRLVVDKHAVIIEDRHAEEEHGNLQRISSTLKGCGAALAEKIQRKPTVKLAKDSEWMRDSGIKVTSVQQPIRHMLDFGATVVGELAQGFDLSLNHGYLYPYVTSRDVTPMSFMNNVGLPAKYLGDVIGVMRTFPIRVGNMYDADGNEVGTSGPFYPDQKELSWDEMSLRLGTKVLERTTVTNKVRRVFTFSVTQYARFIGYCDPTEICLNFCNYFPGINEASTADDLMGNLELTGLLFSMRKFGVPVRYCGTGADNTAMVELL